MHSRWSFALTVDVDIARVPTLLIYNSGFDIKVFDSCQFTDEQYNDFCLPLTQIGATANYNGFYTAFLSANESIKIVVKSIFYLNKNYLRVPGEIQAVYTS